MVERLITGGVDQDFSMIDTTTSHERWCLVRVVLTYPALRTGSIAAYGKMERPRLWDELIANELKIVVCSQFSLLLETLLLIQVRYRECEWLVVSQVWTPA